MQKKINPALIVISILSLANVLFVPLFDVWGGLFPSSPDYNFFDAMEKLFKDADNWNMWVVQFSVSIAIPCIFMLIFSVTGSRKLYATSAGIGIVLWLRIVIQFINQNEMSDVFDLDDSSISIGTWIAIILFIISLTVSLCCGRKNNAAVFSANNNNSIINHLPQSPITIKYCPKCGEEIKDGGGFCGKCGCKLLDNISPTKSTTDIK